MGEKELLGCMAKKKQKLELKHIIVIAIALFVFSGMGETALFATTDVGDPSAVYCEGMNDKVRSIDLQNYNFEVRRDNEGNEYGVCILPDGTECDSWDFFNGKCGQNYTYCELWLGEINTVETGGQFTQEYARCTLKTGIVCPEWAYFNGECPWVMCWKIAQTPEAPTTASETFVRSNYECVEINISSSSYKAGGAWAAEHQHCGSLGYWKAKKYCLRVLDSSECVDDLYCKEQAKVVCDDGLVEYNPHNCDSGKCFVYDTEPCTDPKRNRENCEESGGVWDSDEGCRWRFWVPTELIEQETLTEHECLDVSGEWVNGTCEFPTEGSCFSFLSSGGPLEPEYEGYYGRYSTDEKCNEQWGSEEEFQKEGEETIETPKIETPTTPASPVETPPPGQETEKAPEVPSEGEKGGICGPTVVVLLAMTALLFRCKRTSS